MIDMFEILLGILTIGVVVATVFSILFVIIEDSHMGDKLRMIKNIFLWGILGTILMLIAHAILIAIQIYLI